MSYRALMMALLICTCVVAIAGAQAPVGTAFTYQGQVTHAGVPVNGPTKLAFKLYDANAGGTLLGTQTLNNVPVSNGIFTVRLNGAGEFGANALDGNTRWLEIAVNDSLLTPRQELTGTPYALFALKPWVANGTSISYTAGNVGIGTATPNPSTTLDVIEGLTGNEAIRGEAPNGNAVVGTNNIAGFAAVAGLAEATGGIGVYGTDYQSGNYGEIGTGNEGVYGTSVAGVGVNGQTTNGTGVNGLGYNGVWGTSNNTDGNGLRGECDTGANAYGIWGLSSTGWAGTFSGKAQVTGNFYAGAKFFRIDDPIDPANKTLIHSCVESNEMKNVYDGVATLDGGGQAWVELPAWFESLNQEFRYQLTCIGQPAVVYIAQKISGNRFLIAGGKPGMEVSWMVTGVRHDAYANAHPMQVEVPKEGADRGQYFNPEVYGLPESKSIFYDKMRAAGVAQATPRARPAGIRK